MTRHPQSPLRPQCPKQRALEAIRQAPRPERALFGAKRREAALKAGATFAEIEAAEDTHLDCSLTERYLAQASRLTSSNNIDVSAGGAGGV
jgi:hypothetical protein